MSKRNAVKITHELFKRLGNCVQFNIFDVSKILKRTEQHLVDGGTVESAEAIMSDAIREFRVN
jgi:hypothetical protein